MTEKVHTFRTWEISASLFKEALNLKPLTYFILRNWQPYKEQKTRHYSSPRWQFLIQNISLCLHHWWLLNWKGERISGHFLSLYYRLWSISSLRIRPYRKLQLDVFVLNRNRKSTLRRKQMWKYFLREWIIYDSGNTINNTGSTCIF